MAAGSTGPCPHLQRTMSCILANAQRRARAQGWGPRAGGSRGTGAPLTGSAQPALQATWHALGQEEGCRHTPPALGRAGVPHNRQGCTPTFAPQHLGLPVIFPGADTPSCCSRASMAGSWSRAEQERQRLALGLDSQPGAAAAPLHPWLPRMTPPFRACQGSAGCVPPAPSLLVSTESRHCPKRGSPQVFTWLS